MKQWKKVATVLSQSITGCGSRYRSCNMKSISTSHKNVTGMYGRGLGYPWIDIVFLCRIKRTYNGALPRHIICEITKILEFRQIFEKSCFVGLGWLLMAVCTDEISLTRWCISFFFRIQKEHKLERFLCELMVGFSQNWKFRRFKKILLISKLCLIIDRVLRCLSINLMDSVDILIKLSMY